MINTISKRLVKWLLDTGAISQNQEELFSFAIYTLLFNMAPLLLVVVIGSLFDLIKEGILMLIPFLLIRKFTGGFHLQSPTICSIFSVLLLFGGMLLTRMVVESNGIGFFSILICLAAIQIFCISPIDSDARRLTAAERVVFRRVARYFLLVFGSLYITLCVFDLFSLAAYIGMGILLAGLLQAPCLFQKVYQN